MPKEPYSDWWTGFGMMVWFWGQLMPIFLFLCISRWVELSETDTTVAVLLCGFGWMTVYRNTLGLYILQRIEHYREQQSRLPPDPH